jgi:hypothetical protein
MSVVKMSVNLPADAVEALRDLAKRRNVTMTEVLRDAIATEKYLDTVVSNNGKILVEKPGGVVQEVIFVR